MDRGLCPHQTRTNKGIKHGHIYCFFVLMFNGIIRFVKQRTLAIYNDDNTSNGYAESYMYNTRGRITAYQRVDWWLR